MIGAVGKHVLGPPSRVSTDSRETMKIFIALAAVATLSACASIPADLRKQIPRLELTSSRFAKAVALCIANRWENIDRIIGPGITSSTYPLPLTMRPITDGYMVSIEGLGTRGLADVKNTENGSRTQYFDEISERVLNEKVPKATNRAIEDAVKECQ